jgi:cobalt-zinc-cadmium efflux system outer membrane protein
MKLPSFLILSRLMQLGDTGAATGTRSIATPVRQNRGEQCSALRQLMARVSIFVFLVSILIPASIRAASPTNQLENLTLEQAIELAERQHPQLAEAHALVAAAAGRAQQAGALPNPELIVGAQQLPLDNNASNQREYVAGIAQPIPLGGRLGKAREAELLEREVRVRGLDVTRRDLRKRVHSAFATALYQEQAFEIQNQSAQSVAKVSAITKARVTAGDAAPEELARSEMELARAQLEVQRAQSLRDQALLGLVAAMGDTSLQVKSLTGKLDAVFEVPTLEALAENLATQPELALADANRRASNARIDLARAERIPDIKVEALYHRLEGTKENTFDIGLSIPLPLFDRNQGKLREARAEAAAAEARSRLTENELILRLRESHAQLTAALATSRAFQTEIMPRAEIMLKATEARYAAGDTSLADVLRIRRDWAAMQLAQLESMRDVMQAWAEVSGYVRTR